MHPGSRSAGLAWALRRPVGPGAGRAGRRMCADGLVRRRRSPPSPQWGAGPLSPGTRGGGGAAGRVGGGGGDGKGGEGSVLVGLAEQLEDVAGEAQGRVHVGPEEQRALPVGELEDESAEEQRALPAGAGCKLEDERAPLPS